MYPCPSNATETCNVKVQALYTQYYRAIMATAAVLAAIEVFGLIFAFAMAVHKKEDLADADLEMK